MTQEVVNNNNWKTRILLIGTAVGAVVGLGTAYLLARTAEEEHNGPPQISTADALKAGISVVGVVRGIASLANRKK
ncbi:MAG: hypothetical protein GWN13_25185 [Phycisphaerae bacterium]|nr:hypothetical protein [Phycisphaerae bacterium]NIX01472.1 hypothetical protein [Phycisphaerae bacterium]